jgi:endonuclease YncB( thermonuclease family)
MFLYPRALVHPRAGGFAFAAAGLFVCGLAAGALIAPQFSPRVAARAAPSAPVSEAAATAEKAGASRAAYPAQVLRVVDGDTFEARVSVWPGLEITTKVRLRGIDAPELRARCTDEQAKAQAARAALVALLGEGAVAVSQVTLDKYGGRVVADASTRRTPDVAAALLAAGHARPYGGGRRESWCAE